MDVRPQLNASWGNDLAFSSPAVSMVNSAHGTAFSLKSAPPPEPNPADTCAAADTHTAWSALHAAVSSGQLQLIPTIISNTGSLNATDENGTSAVHLCCTQKKWVALNTLLHHGADPNAKDRSGRTPLHIACESNAIHCCKSLLSAGADWEAVDSNGRPALQRAIETGHLACIAEVLRAVPHAGALVPRSGWSFLHEAASRDRPAVLRTIAEATASGPPQQPGPQGLTCLHLAAFVGAFDTAKYLISRGIASAPIDDWGCTPLHWACCAGHKLLAAVLIRTSGLLNSPDLRGRAPIHIASLYGRPACLQLLLQRGVDPALRVQQTGQVPLHFIAGRGHIACLELLLSGPWKCKVNVRDLSGRTPLHCAAAGNAVACCAYLVKHGAGLQVQCHRGLTPLAIACSTSCVATATLLVSSSGGAGDGRYASSLLIASRYGSLDMVKLLLNAGCDPDCTDSEGHTSLMAAACGGQRQICEFLLGEKGADVFTTTAKGQRNAAHYAAQEGQVAILELFASHLGKRSGARSSVALFATSDWDGFTPLHHAAMWGRCDAVKFLLGGTTLAPQQGFSPYHCAARFGHAGVLALLSSEEYDISQVLDPNQCTPLHYAAHYGHVEALSCLCNDYFLALEVVDLHGDAALHKASAMGHHEAVDLLLSRGAAHSTANDEGWEPIHLAAMSGSEGAVSALLSKVGMEGAASTTACGSTPLHLAARTASEGSLRVLLGAFAKQPAGMKRTAKNESDTATRILMECLEKADSSWMTPLDWAVANSHQGCIDLLLPLSASQSSALHLACLRDARGTVKRFLEHGFSPYVLDSRDMTPAHCAAMSGSCAALACLPPDTLFKGDSRGATPLLTAALHRRVDVLAQFYSGPHFESADREGKSYQHYAALGGCLDTFRYTVEAIGGGTANPVAHPSLTTPLHIASARGCEPVVSYILGVACKGHGPWECVNLVDVNGDTPLHGAAAGGHADMCTLLLRHGARLADQNMHGWTCIDSAFSSAPAVEKMAVLRALSHWCMSHPQIPSIVKSLENCLGSATGNMTRGDSVDTGYIMATDAPISPRHKAGDDPAWALVQEEVVARHDLAQEWSDLTLVLSHRLTRQISRCYRKQVRVLKTNVDEKRRQVRSLKRITKTSLPLVRMVMSQLQYIQRLENVTRIYFGKLLRYSLIVRVNVKRSRNAASGIKAVDFADECDALAISFASKGTEPFNQTLLGRIDQLRPAIETGDIDEAGDASMTLLQTACTCSRSEVVRVLLSKGADPNAAPFGELPIHICIEVGAMSCLRELVVSPSINLDGLSGCGFNPVSHAAILNRDGMRKFLEEVRSKKESAGSRLATRVPSKPGQDGESEMGILQELLQTDASLAADHIEELVSSSPGEARDLLTHITSRNRNTGHFLIYDEDGAAKTILEAALHAGVFEEMFRQDLDGNTIAHILACEPAQNGVLDIIVEEVHGYALDNPSSTLVTTLFAKTNTYGDTPIHLAASQCNAKFVSTALSSCDPNVISAVPNPVGMLPVHEACKAGSAEIWKKLKFFSPCDGGFLGWCPILYACCTGKLSLLRDMYPEVQRKSGKYEFLTPLHVACRFGHAHCVAFLLDSGEDSFVKTSDIRQQTALHLAVRGGFLECITALLDKTMQTVPSLFNEPDGSGSTPLHQSAFYGHADIVNCLLGKPDIDIDPFDKLGNTPLHYAAMGWYLGIVRTLLDAGANIDAEGIFGWNPLTFACGRPDLATEIISGIRIAPGVDGPPSSVVFYDREGLNFDEVDRSTDINGRVVFLFRIDASISIGTADVPIDSVEFLRNGEWLLTEDASTRVRDGTDISLFNPIVTELLHRGSLWGEELIRVAVIHKRSFCLRQLLLLGIIPRMPAGRELLDTVVHQACRISDNRLCCILILETCGSGFTVCFNSEFETPLHVAGKLHDLDMVEYLASVTSDINISHPSGVSALVDVVSRGDVEIAKVLMAFGASPSLPSGQWWSALHCAVDRQQQEVMLHLIHEELIGINTPLNDDNASVMHFASQKESLEPMISSMIANGGKFNSPMTRGGYSPLHIACSVGNLGVINIVMVAGLTNAWRAGATTGDAVPFVAALHHRQTRLVQILLTDEAFTSCAKLKESFYDTDINGMNALHVAVFEGYCEEVICMLESGIQARPWGDRSLVHIAASAGRRSVKVLGYLLQQEGAARALVSEAGEDHTPLHMACAADCTEGVALLLSHGANIDALSHGETPLHVAVRCASDHAVHMLVRKGADRSILNSSGCEARGVAMQSGLTYLLPLLSQGLSGDRRAVAGGPFGGSVSNSSLSYEI